MKTENKGLTHFFYFNPNIEGDKKRAEIERNHHEKLAEAEGENVIYEIYEIKETS